MNDTLRVLRITPHLFRQGIWPVAYDPVGGLQNQVWRLSKQLDEAGVVQTVVTTHIPGHARRTAPARDMSVESVGISLPRFAAGKLLNFTWFLSVAKRLLTGDVSCDLIHIHYNHSVWCRVLTLLARRLGVPVVVSLSTELWVARGRWMQRLEERCRVVRRIERYAMRSSDCVIALTEGDASRLETDLRVDPDRIAVVPDAVRVEDFEGGVDARSASQLRSRFLVPEGGPIVSYVGRIRGEKGWRDLPALVEELARIGGFLLICGDGPDRRRLERALSRSGCPDAWRITGFLSPGEVQVALKLSDVLVLPSRREAFGGVLLEAMAAGVPAVAYGVGGVVEVAGSPHAVALVSPSDGAAFRRTVLELLADPDLRSTLVERGRRRVRDYSLSRTSRKTADIYASLCRRPVSCGSEAHSGNDGAGLNLS